jgi:hypothetical protein
MFNALRAELIDEDLSAGAGFVGLRHGRFLIT